MSYDIIAAEITTIKNINNETYNTNLLITYEI